MMFWGKTYDVSPYDSQRSHPSMNLGVKLQCIAAESIFWFYWSPNSCKISEKDNGWSLRYLKERLQTDGQGQSLRTLSDNPLLNISWEDS